MFLVNCATTAACALYGVYVYRVLRHAEYHDLRWLFRRNRTHPPATGQDVSPASYLQSGGSQHHAEPADHPDHRGELRAVRCLYPQTGLSVDVKNDELETSSGSMPLHPDWPPEGSQN
jgi:hypothetical protein